MKSANLITRVLFTGLIGLMFFVPAYSVFADDAVVLGKGRAGIISGVVIETGRTSIIMRSNDTDIHVDMSALDIGKSLSEFVKPGTLITVSGQFTATGNHPEFQAREVTLGNQAQQ